MSVDVSRYVLLLLSPLLSALWLQLEGDGFKSVRSSPLFTAATCLVGTRGWRAKQEHPAYVPHTWAESSGQ
jgi:hypothetical protein